MPSNDNVSVIIALVRVPTKERSTRLGIVTVPLSSYMLGTDATDTPEEERQNKAA